MALQWLPCQVPGVVGDWLARCQDTGRVATEVPIFKSLVGLDPGKIPSQVRYDLEADALITRPKRRWVGWRGGGGGGGEGAIPRSSATKEDA